MKVAAPMASSFVAYILGLTTMAIVLKKAKERFRQSRYIVASAFIVLGLVAGIWTIMKTSKPSYAKYVSNPQPANEPIGEGKGINPGRVVWIYDPDATDENCKNSWGDYWSDDDNTNQSVINAMLSQGLKMLTNEETDSTAWDAIFRYYNQTHGKGDVGYQAGEKFVIKINLNSGTSGFSYERWDYKTVDTSPQIVYAILDQLVNKAGVAQADIGIGDPGRTVDNLFWDKCHPDFPDIKYWGEGNGRTPIVASDNYEIFTSDGQLEYNLPTCYLEAAYMINIPVLKKHHRAGISLSSKNHFGALVPFLDGAWAWHYSLPCSEGGGQVNNGDYGLYRCFVDIMGHKHIGGKTILYIIDGIWSSTNWAHPPIKWRMAPFNNDWPSSIFVSQDPVAIESIGFDFLYEEFDEDHPTEGDYDPSDHKGPFPHYPGVDDFLHQAADSLNWPENITYDPENDGTNLPRSLGTHEHWNNAVDKKYLRNLGEDRGIELISNYTPTIIEENNDLSQIVNDFILHQNYPNPFNSTTTIWYQLSIPSRVNLSLYNARGQKIKTIVDEHQGSGSYVQRWDGLMDNGLPAPTGIYFYKITAQYNDQSFKQVKKMVLSK